MLVEIENNANLSRDIYSKAIINNNSEEYRRAVESKQKRFNTQKRLEDIETQMMEIKSTVSQMLVLLKGQYNG